MKPRQLQLLRVLQERQARDGICPSYREMTRAIGLTGGSVSTVHRLIASLEKDGWVRRQPGVHRAIEVLRMPGAVLTEAEVSWCHQHAAAVRALMDRAG